jgi:hypothetical protein
VDARRRHQSGEAVEQFRRRQEQWSHEPTAGQSTAQFWSSSVKPQRPVRPSRILDDNVPRPCDGDGQTREASREWPDG